MHWIEKEPAVTVPEFRVDQPTSSRQKILVKFETPILAGGAASGRADEHQAVRPTAVRSGIRWWWRQVVLCKHFEDRALTKDKIIEKLQEEEWELWGNTNGPGTINVHVRTLCTGATHRVDEWEQGGPTKYAWGMMDSPRKRSTNPWIVEGVAAEIDVRGTDEHLTQAIDCWLTFGGIGGRVRRGFGAIKHDRDVDVACLIDLMKSVPITGWTGQTLAGARLFRREGDGAQQAWILSLKSYANFRKGNMPNAPRRSQDKAESHSRWPEADSLRKLQHVPLKQHHNLLDGRSLVPRADLGLPLTIRFSRDEPGEPGTLTYGPSDEPRIWPSPVITKPAWIDGEWVACILVLNSPGPRHDLIRWDTNKADSFNTDATAWPDEWFTGTGRKRFGKLELGQAIASKAFAEYLTREGEWQCLGS